MLFCIILTYEVIMIDIICIDVQNKENDYSLIRVSDKDGWYCTYAGEYLSAFRMFEETESIQLAKEVYP
jgi:hypothetical protein